MPSDEQRACERCRTSLPVGSHFNRRYCMECRAARKREHTRAAMRDRRLPFDKGGPVSKYGRCSECGRVQDLYHHKEFRNLHCCSKACLDKALANIAANPYAYLRYELGREYVDYDDYDDEEDDSY